MSESIGLGIIGCGRISGAHLQAIAAAPDAETVAAADIDSDRLSRCADEYGIARRYADWHDLVADDAVDAVVICLPHDLHFPAAIAAAECKKHILTEKPMAISLEECDGMIRAAEENGVVLMVAQVLRRYPCNQHAKALIADGKVGRVSSVVRRRTSFSPQSPERVPWHLKPEVSGGLLLYGLGSHEYDAVLWLLDTRADTVFAVGNKGDPQWDDYVDISGVVRLESGAIAAVIQSLNCREGAWDCVVVGADGTLAIRNDQVSLNGQVTPTPLDSNAAFREQLGEFLQCVRTGREPGPSGRNVRATMALLEGVKMSLAEGRSVNVAQL